MTAAPIFPHSAHADFYGVTTPVFSKDIKKEPFK